MDLDRFNTIGVIKNTKNVDHDMLTEFENTIYNWISDGSYTRAKIIELFDNTIENFKHKDTGKFLDNGM